MALCTSRYPYKVARPISRPSFIIETGFKDGPKKSTAVRLEKYMASQSLRSESVLSQTMTT